MKLIFFGSPRFAVPTLEKLAAEKFDIELVVTNPDQPAGRGYAVQASPIKQTAERLGLGVFQPRRLKDPGVRERLAQTHPDAAVVVAYGHILPQWLIDIPRLGCINLHASLLPKYRGAAPIQWALMRGEQVTGVTTMKIDAGMDTGDILLLREITIGPEDTRRSLEDLLSVIGADLMVETLFGLEHGAIVPRPQDPTRASLAPMLRKEHGKIDWLLPAAEIARHVRALEPWPGTYSNFRGRTLHLRAAVPAQNAPPPGAAAGELLAHGASLLVACGEGTALEVREVQLEGRKRMSAHEFLNGARIRPGEKLGI